MDLVFESTRLIFSRWQIQWRRWICIKLLQDYCEAALGRFVRDPQQTAKPVTNPDVPSTCYRVPRPGILWNDDTSPELRQDGGKKRRLKPTKTGAGKSQKTQASSDDHDEAIFVAAALPVNK